MNSIIDFLSGEVPGGILLLLLVLSVINLTLFFFFKGSKLFSKNEYRQKVIKSTVFVIAVYISVWFVLRPAQIPDSVLIVPFQKNSKCDFVSSESIERQLKENLSDSYRLHYWEWFYEACNEDSINDFNYRNSLAGRLNIDFIISGKYLSDSVVEVFIVGEDNSAKKVNFNSYQDMTEKVLSWLDEKNQILDDEKIITSKPIKNIELLTQAKLSYLTANYENAINLIINIPEESVLLKARINLKLGITEIKDNQNSMFKDEENKYFAKVINSLIPIAREGNDTADLNRILGELYLYENKYKEAEIFLKKGLTQNPYDARIYYDMYYLHEDRIKDLGFDSRFDVLKKAIELDNGYVAAVYELANEYFQTGTASSTGRGTTYAMETLNTFMKINSRNQRILNLLANIYLQIKSTEKAINLYKILVDMKSDPGEIYYNLGIGYFHLKKYEDAKSAFKKSISINDYPDSYLYLGAINKITGNNEKALYYYRERIKRSKKGEDDLYAKEAMRGIRLILAEQSQDSSRTN